MKRKLSIILALALLLTLLLPFSASAAGESFKLYFTFDKESYLVGETVTAKVHLDRTDTAEDYKLLTFESGVTFNPLYLNYIDSSGNTGNAKEIRVLDKATYHDISNQYIGIFYHGRSTPLERTASLTLAELKFTAMAAINSGSLSFYSPAATITSGGKTNIDVINGVFTIGNPKAPTYAATFKGGDGATGTAPVLAEMAEGDLFQLPENTFTKTGYTFSGWSDGAKTYAAGERYTMAGKPLAFTAQWTKDPVKHKVTFVPGEGTEGNAPTLSDTLTGSKFTLPTQGSLLKTNNTFTGWAKDGTVYQPGDVFTMPDADVTFTAAWRTIDEEGNPIGDPENPDDPTPDGWKNPYSDVAESDWFYSYVKYMDQHGLMGGVGSGTFAPNGDMTRGMIVTILYRAAGSPAVTAENKFTDVPAGQWYTDAVIWAEANNIVGGYGGGRFGPLDPLTRQQMIAILWRAKGSPAPKSVSAVAAQFPDWDKVGSYAVDAMAWAYENGVVNGINGKIAPTGTAKRAQFAAIMARMG